MKYGCALRFVDRLRRAWDREFPGWTHETVFCQWCGVEHDIYPADNSQRPMLAPTEPQGRRQSKWFRILDNGVRCTHRSNAPVLTGRCAYCSNMIHVHEDDMGRVKSGRHGTGYLEEKCIACHRVNAVYQAYGLGGIRVEPAAEGKSAAAMQMDLI